MNEATHDQGSTQRVRTFGTVVATVCIVGLAGLIFLHAERQGVQAGEASYTAPAADSATTDFLHAPATDSSVPSADQVFASQRLTPVEPAEAVPTF